jgi:paraquat-inducible protein B
MQKASPTLIGGFVMGAIVLALGGVIFLGGGDLLKDTDRLVIYFDGSVNGLTIGAPVKLEGVEIGEVTSIRAIASLDPLSFQTETIVELDRTRFERRIGDRVLDDSPSQVRDTDLIRQGLRARLEMQSFITGQLYVSLVVEPDSEAILLAATQTPYAEIPAVPTTTQEIERNVRAFFAKVEGMPLEEIVENLNGTLAEARGAFAQANATLAVAEDTIAPGSPVTYQLAMTLQELTESARAIRVLADYIEKNPNSLVFGRAQVNP